MPIANCELTSLCPKMCKIIWKGSFTMRQFSKKTQNSEVVDMGDCANLTQFQINEFEERWDSGGCHEMVQ